MDKTNLISLMNERIGSEECLVCISRPRRFGKTYNVKMLTAYYDCSCNSHALFDNRQIAKMESYEKHLNQYNVIMLDITGFISEVKKGNGVFLDVPKMIEKALWKDLIEMGFVPGSGDNLNDFLLRCTQIEGGRPFIFIIDEWDAVIREAKGDLVAQVAYLNLLRGWFKDSAFTPKAVAAAYLTGILPIRKDGSQSAVSDFKEYSMLQPSKSAGLVGFTENEVRGLCAGHCVSFEEIMAWYDGYDLQPVGSIYNPYSVREALEFEKCRAYWKTTSEPKTLLNYINMDFEGIQESVARLIAGERIIVNVDSFQNDFESSSSADDVLTLLVHLGYLTYHENDGTVQIPNEEIRGEFRELRKEKQLNQGWMRQIDRG
ncbi:MAG: AAA family ATPase [Clostridia bacterium]|nr:AAA family ATPase [Clostridia bacterium]